jgi:RNA polymerase sigma-70 factor (ECF subfamily)
MSRATQRGLPASLDRFISGARSLHSLHGRSAHGLSENRAARQTSEAQAQPALSTEGVFQAHAPFAWRVLRRLGVADADADDVCQEVFVTVHRKLGTFEGRSSVRTWLYGICVRTASDYRKRVRGRHEVPTGAVLDSPIDARQEDDMALRQARAALDGILDRLDDDKRAVFVLYEIEELPMADVATAVDCPLQTAYSRLHAARREVDAAVRRIQAKEGAA